MNKVRILIVEDHPHWKTIVRQYTESAVPNAQIIAEADIAAGWTNLCGSEPPDLLIADIMWPRIPGKSLDEGEPDGSQLAQEALARKIPFIAITFGAAPKVIRNLFVRDRISDLFVKGDFERDEFIRRVREILKSRVSENAMTQQRIKEWIGDAKRTMLAVVQTDMVGSTRLAARVGDEPWKHIIEAHYAAGRRLIQRHGGCEVDTIGDAFLVVFRTPVEGVEFCLDFHADTGVGGVNIRAGCHVGTVEVSEKPLGNAIHLLSRVMKVIQGPEVWVTDEAKVLIDQTGADSLRKLNWTEQPDCDLGEYGHRDLWSVRR